MPVSVLLAEGAFRHRLHTWVRGNPEATLALLPEWQALLPLLQA